MIRICMFDKWNPTESGIDSVGRRLIREDADWMMSPPPPPQENNKDAAPKNKKNKTIIPFVTRCSTLFVVVKLLAVGGGWYMLVAACWSMQQPPTIVSFKQGIRISAQLDEWANCAGRPTKQTICGWHSAAAQIAAISAVPCSYFMSNDAMASHPINEHSKYNIDFHPAAN